MSEAPALVIRGGRVLDRTGERTGDVLIGEDGTILAVGDSLDAPEVLDASGCVVAPALVDLACHVCEPGYEEAETIETASRAAVLGGYAAIVATPDTAPVIDSPGAVRQVQAIASGALCHVAVAGTVTVGMAGERLAPMLEMAELGVRLFGDTGVGIQDARLMRRALEYASGIGATVVQHCDVADLSVGGHMHEGEWSSKLGLAGVAPEAEEIMVMRDIALARLTGGRVHFQQLTTASSAAMVAAARESGLQISSAVSPHHLALSEEELGDYDPVFKTFPPLRPVEDTMAMRQAVVDGAIDAIATDHHPCTPDAKFRPFDQAPAGMLGLETALGVVSTVLDGGLDDIFAAMSWEPARIAGLGSRHGGLVAEGGAANLVVFDPSATWTVDKNDQASLSRNTPFHGHTLQGRVRHTIVEGEAVVIDAEAQR